MQDHAQWTMIGIGPDRVHMRNLHHGQQCEQRQTHQHYGETIQPHVATGSRPSLRFGQRLNPGREIL